ncbi:DUF1489 family protein [Tepidamorphus sp. 3E244]|uniref:DUF1489 family protein n=1 Tax=Tepidamorphus sp. 3E244 TaxID=3385498 RepID=UPI0038FC286A
MSTNLVKLCVGASSIEDLEGWIKQRKAAAERGGKTYEQFHTTRQMPKARDELLAGGSLYWVIRGMIACRQEITDLRPVTDAEGISRCQIVLAQPIIRVRPQPRGPFQGWRYLKPDDAPPDLAKGQSGEMPDPEMARALAELGLL